MAHSVPHAFSLFYNAINLSGYDRDAANARKDWIVQRLKPRLTVLDSFTIGSIPRYTALAEHADLDIFVALDTSHFLGKTPSSLLVDVKTALGPGAGSVRSNGQAVTMLFSSWPNVDVVPAKRFLNSDGSVQKYQIPDAKRNAWIDTRPRNHSKRMKDAASERGDGFKKAVTILKHWNRRQSVTLQSYHLEVIALKVATDWNDTPWALYQWFQQAQEHVYVCYDDDGSDAAAYMAYTDSELIRAQLTSAENLALSAWAATTPPNYDDEKAIRTWRALFGTKFPTYG